MPFVEDRAEGGAGTEAAAQSRSRSQSRAGTGGTPSPASLPPPGSASSSTVWSLSSSADRVRGRRLIVARGYGSVAPVPRSWPSRPARRLGLDFADLPGGRVLGRRFAGLGAGTPTGPTAAVSAVVGSGSASACDGDALRQLQTLHGVVGGGQDRVGQRANVLDQPLALLPEKTGVDHHLLGSTRRPRAGPDPPPRRPLAGDGRRRLGEREVSGIGGRVGALEDARCLDSHVVEGLLHGALARLIGLELGHQRAYP